MHSGLFDGTYIFGPHARYVSPAKRWAVRLAGRFPFRLLLIKDAVALVPEFVGDDRLYLMAYPLTLWL